MLHISLPFAVLLSVARTDGVERSTATAAAAIALFFDSSDMESLPLNNQLPSLTRRTSCRRENRHHSHAPTTALRAHEPPVLGDVNEDHFPELQFLERLYRLMVAVEAMDVSAFSPPALVWPMVLLGLPDRTRSNFMWGAPGGPASFYT